MNKPTDSVRIVLFNKAEPQRFLVLAEADDPTNWKLPGGKFNSTDESPDAAASRELEEELSLSAEQTTLMRVGDLTNDDGVSARYIYAGKIDPHEIKPSVEIASIQWVSEDTIPESPNKHHMLTAVALTDKYRRG